MPPVHSARGADRLGIQWPRHQRPKVPEAWRKRSIASGSRCHLQPVSTDVGAGMSSFSGAPRVTDPSHSVSTPVLARTYHSPRQQDEPAPPLSCFNLLEPKCTLASPGETLNLVPWPCPRPIHPKSWVLGPKHRYFLNFPGQSSVWPSSEWPFPPAGTQRLSVPQLASPTPALLRVCVSSSTHLPSITRVLDHAVPWRAERREPPLPEIMLPQVTLW